MMPPPGMPRPAKQQADAFVSWMEGYLDAAAALDPNPGEVALHRLNRKEYANAIYDILGLKVDATELLPPGAQSDGFDNIANMLQASPVFFNQYMAAARSVAVQAVGRPDPRPGSKTYFNTNKGAQAFHVDGLPLGTRGGFAVDHFFPPTASTKSTCQARCATSGSSGSSTNRRSSSLWVARKFTKPASAGPRTTGRSISINPRRRHPPPRGERNERSA